MKKYVQRLTLFAIKNKNKTILASIHAHQLGKENTVKLFNFFATDVLHKTRHLYEVLAHYCINRTKINRFSMIRIAK